MNEPKQKNRIVGRIGKAPLALLKPALAFKKNGSPCVIDIAFIEDAVGELVAVNGDLLLEKRLVVKDGHYDLQVG